MVTEQEPVNVGARDPWTSHVASERIQPTRGTKRERVLALLRDAEGAWVRGHQITEVGGSEGLRRLRELRQMGWAVERQPALVGSGWWYRLGGA